MNISKAWDAVCKKESQIFDDIYTGTETRDPLITDQLLQQYESYEIFRYLNNIRPNGGNSERRRNANGTSCSSPCRFSNASQPVAFSEVAASHIFAKNLLERLRGMPMYMMYIRRSNLLYSACPSRFSSSAR
jgi:hypothetical protein